VLDTPLRDSRKAAGAGLVGGLSDSSDRRQQQGSPALLARCTLWLRSHNSPPPGFELARLASSMIYKGYVIDVGERESARWIARISRFDRKIIQAGRGWQNAFYDTMATTTAIDAVKYAKAAIDGRLIR
jgi:hypothetical protein